MWSFGLSSPITQKAESKLAAQSAQTRSRLIETTLQLLAEHNFHRLSLDAIAKQAGVTKGAIYHHFKNKDELLMATLASKPSARPDMMIWPPREGTVRQRLRRLGEFILAQQGEPGGDATGAVQFLLYALSNEELKAQMGNMTRMTREGIEAKTRALFDPEELPMSVELFAHMLTSMILPGIMFSRGLHSELDKETILAIFEGLAGRQE
jgi:AcrR family transcriptional regulator